MKSKDIKVGETYMMKVSGRVVPVRVEAIREISDYKGRTRTVYDCRNTITDRACSARSATKFRGVSCTTRLVKEVATNDPPDRNDLGAFRGGGAEDYYVWKERQRRYARADRPEGY